MVRGAPKDAAILTTPAMNLKFLGNVSGGGGPIWRLAEVRLWNLGLSDAEIAAHARLTLSGDERGLCGY